MVIEQLDCFVLGLAQYRFGTEGLNGVVAFTVIG